MKRIIRAIALILTISMLAVLPACKTEKVKVNEEKKKFTPMEYLDYSFTKSTASFSGGKLEKFAEKTTECALAEFDLSGLIKLLGGLAVATGVDLGNVDDAVCIGKLWLGNEKCAGQVDIGLAGESLILNGFLSDEAIIVTSNLFDEAYGIKPENIFSTVVTRAASNDVMFGEEDGEDIMAYGETGGSGASVLISLIKFISENSEKVSAYAEKAVDILKKNAAMTLTDKTGGGKTVTISYNNSSLEKSIREFMTAFAADADAGELLSKLSEAIGTEIAMPTSENIDGFIKNINDSATFTLTLTLDTNSSDVIEKAVVNFTADIDGENGTILLTLDLTEKDKYVLSFDISGEDADAGNIVAEYKVTGDTSEKYNSEFSVKSNGEAVLGGNLEYTKSSGDYTLKLNVGSESETLLALTLNGKCTCDENKFELTVDTIKIGEGDVSMELALGIRTTVTNDATMPEFPTEYKDFMTLTEDERNALSDKIENSKIIGLLGGLFGSSGGDEEWDDEEWDDEEWDDEGWDDEEWEIEMLPVA